MHFGAQTESLLLQTMLDPNVSDIIRKKRHSLPYHQSGHASVDNAQTLFLIDNVMNGFSLHRLDNAVYI
jgi:hypothetical protein